MRILALTKAFFLALTLFISCYNSNAQATNITVKQDTKFEQLLNEKRKTNISNAINERYQIQIFSGESEKAKSTLNEFRQEFKDIDATIFFFTPNYKVWVGNFKTKIDAERNLIEIRKKYNNVHLIKPNK
ncbi:SPOR domain-containing protein [Flavobacterium sp. GP15]|uniref:SPOR domain-containing protein n=1 Tax=Flavobacterium sp. GP15 TaxID=2758567 RepID=UPI00165D4FAC|nr:SPOR domain-containing protein [Flavobacterium sp. GP15]